MNNKQKIVTAVCFGLACGIVLRSAISKTDRVAVDVPAAPAPVIAASNPLAVNDVKTPEPIAEAPAATAVEAQKVGGDDNDGKTVLAPDGKEVIPTDGKEVLPPIKELINSQPQMVDPALVGPPAEYRDHEPNGNPLLNPPNPQNVGGPVVSPETR